MADSYRVCIVVPQGYKHSYAFLEAATLILLSLRDLGYDCDLRPNELASDRVNIVLGYHLVSSAEVFKGVRYIPWQLEQLSDGEGIFSERILGILSCAEQIWDYAIENIAFLEKKGLEAKHLPVGYHSGLERIPHREDKDIDVLFFGSVNQRRRKILQAIANEGVGIKTLFGVYGEQRDKIIGRSKIIVNIHNYEAQIFESIRVSYLLNNGCFVLSETSPVYPYPHVEMIRTQQERLAEECLRWLSDGAFKAHARKTHEEFKSQYPMARLIKAVLSKT
ncbi:MAG: hypothetical protein ACOC4C_03780 [Fibrobacterota bacterium]